VRGEPEDGFERDVPMKAAVIAKYEFIEIGVDMFAAQTMIRPQRPTLQQREGAVAPGQNDGVARSLGWKVHMRCAHGYLEGTRSMRRCVYRKLLDLETLVCTRGPNFPLSRLESRLMCPSCRRRRVTVVFEPQVNAQVGSG
jgi:hypothetical protein